MADSEKPKPPESPTTARELDFDDDDDVTTTSSPRPKPANASAAAVTTAATGPSSHVQSEQQTGGPPPQPPRLTSPKAQAESTLKEAFPEIDMAVIKAVLMASGGQLEPAFNALLGMSDPTAVQREDAPPPPPPRPTAPQMRQPGQSQIEQDEMYARQLAQHYDHQEARARNRQVQPSGRDPRLEQQSPNQMGYHDDEDRERSFIDDELPVIRDNIRKGFLETQSKVNSFITNLRKRIDGEEEEEAPPPQPPRRPNQASQRGNETGRRSGDEARYDADPEVLGDDFTGLQLRDETAPKTASRPLANPDLFKPTPATPGSTAGSGRRVSFQDGPPEDIDESLHRGSPDPTKRPSSTNSKSKWQPLASVQPDPVSEHDPFSLGDSDDEDGKKKEPKPEDTARLQKATAEAMADEIGLGEKKDNDQTTVGK